MNIRFYLMRLKKASPAELLCRTMQTVAAMRIKVQAKFGGPPPLTRLPEKKETAALVPPDLVRDRVDGSIGGADGETRDPDAARTDIRMRWEPARLQSAMVLMASAQGRVDGPKRRAGLEKAASIVLDWIDANPFPEGEHYRSAMECALRIPVFFFALRRLEELAGEDRRRILAAIHSHARWVSTRLSLHSSLGNHTVTEAVGLLFAGAVYRSSAEGRRWLATGLRLLDAELPHQINADGGPAEQSLDYHRFVLDLYWLAMDFVHKNDLGDVTGWKKRLLTGERFLAAFSDRRGRVPAIGDSDSGRAVGPGLAPLRGVAPAPRKVFLTLADSGYTIIRNERLLLTFDHGPLGMAPFYNHGHADALSITLSVNGDPVLVDPGTYRYNGVARWRTYFKGTRAHNTVTIDGQDQAVQQTGFIWSDPYTARLTDRSEDRAHLLLSADHDGYARLRPPVRHRRSIYFLDEENIIVKDRFFGQGIHCFQLNFHLHPDAVVTKKEKWWGIDLAETHAFMYLVEGELQSVSGQSSPPMGWFSSRYGHKQPTCTLTTTQTGKAEDIVFTTVICTRAPIESDIVHAKAEDLDG